jgi:ribosomal protein S16
MVIGRKKVRFTATQESLFRLVYDGQLIVHEMTIKFALSSRMRIINYLTLFPPKEEPATAEIRFRYDDQTRWLYQGIWADTETIETVIQDECIKYLIVATYKDDKWFPVKEISGEPLPNSFIVEVQLRSQRDGKVLGKPLQEEIVTEEGILTKQDIIISDIKSCNRRRKVV